MEQLIEYRPGRYAWADPATGEVIRRATPEEADAAIRELLARQTPEPLDLPTGAGEPPALGLFEGAGELVSGPKPQDLATGDGDPTLGQPGGEISDLEGPKPQDLGTGAGLDLGQPGRAAELVDGPNPAPVATDPTPGNPGAGLALFWQLGPGDLGASLAEAVTCFQSKPAFGGQRPGVVRACPDLAADGIRGPAQALGLRVKADWYVLPGTVYLGREER